MLFREFLILKVGWGWKKRRRRSGEEKGRTYHKTPRVRRKAEPWQGKACIGTRGWQGTYDLCPPRTARCPIQRDPCIATSEHHPNYTSVLSASASTRCFFVVLLVRMECLAKKVMVVFNFSPCVRSCGTRSLGYRLPSDVRGPNCSFGALVLGRRRSLARCRHRL